jgi:TRAP-type mannitol/chloroaromatic compound transport system permease large subunit
MFTGIQQLLAGRSNGSLYLAVLITATIFAAATGIVGSARDAARRDGRAVDDQAAATIAKMSAGAIAAGGTLGILIPPSRDADRDGARWSACRPRTCSPLR